MSGKSVPGHGYVEPMKIRAVIPSAQHAAVEDPVLTPRPSAHTDRNFAPGQTIDDQSEIRRLVRMCALECFVHRLRAAGTWHRPERCNGAVTERGSTRVELAMGFDSEEGV